MRLATFSLPKQEFVRLGVLHDASELLDVTDALTDVRTLSRPDPMLELVRGGDAELDRVREVAESAGSLGMPHYTLHDVQLRTPIAAPGNIYCIGLNYVAHAAEFDRALDRSKEAELVVFTKSSNSVIGPGESIRMDPRLTSQVDYEAEMAVIIGKAGRDIPEAKAWDHVFGITALNDVTARDIQGRQRQWTLAKSPDTFCPLGPVVVTVDEVTFPVELPVQSRVNGELRQDGNTKQLIFDIPEVIATISAGHSLVPGDVIATGTPSGVGMGFDPPRYLTPGDVVEVEVGGVGVLRNTCVTVGSAGDEAT